MTADQKMSQTLLPKNRQIQSLKNYSVNWSYRAQMLILNNCYNHYYKIKHKSNMI